jgi:RNA methyltransferase, TrmH family
MLSRNQVKTIQSLRQKKSREEQGLFIAEGVKIVPELLASAIEVLEVYATADFISSCRSNAPFIEVKQSELERISGLSTPNEVLAVCRIPSRTLRTEDLRGKLSLVLDDIRDPGNLGTIIRIADWFGISDIICSETSADAFNPKVVQATMGSIARVKIHPVSLVKFLSETIRGLELPVFGTVLEGESIYAETLGPNGLIVIGNESHGISDEVAALLSHKISIPSYADIKKNGGEAESLNAAIATAVVCAEFRRQFS